MKTLIQKFLALFSSSHEQESAEPLESLFVAHDMPLASPTYLREFAHRIGLEVDDLSPAEQSELKARLDRSMDFREENYAFLYHQVYELGHGYSLTDASRVSAQIAQISADSTARAFLNYRENAVAAEALMAAGSLLKEEGELAAGERLFALAEARRHRSSTLDVNVANVPVPQELKDDDDAAAKEPLDLADPTAEGKEAASADLEAGPESESPGLSGLMGPTQKNTETSL